jgi:Icc-related predicted phosphoesterase
VKIFFTSDVHGSERTYLKFLNAGKFYKADVQIVGGDITGKVMIPIFVEDDGTFKVHFLGADYVFKEEKQVIDIEKKIRDNGFYSFREKPDEIMKINSSQEKKDALFEKLMSERLRSWLQIADQRLADRKVACYIMPGNDDAKSVDAVFEESKSVVNPEGKVVQIGEGFEMISSGYSNMTPWNCPRDIPEDQMAANLEAMTSQVKDMSRCIFNLHCPPYGTNIDQAPKLDANQQPQLGPSGTVMESVGSTAVAESIKKHQPLLGLHGHIHESRGICRIGRTICVNPGSEYGEGILRGAIISLKDDRVQSYSFTSG